MKVLHRLTSLLLATLMLLGSFSTPAIAKPAAIRIANTEGMGVALRQQPNTHGTPLLRIPEGTSPDYQCYIRGQLISRTNVWFKVKYGGRTGFYSAYYDTTDAVKLQDPTRHYGIVRCLEQPFEISAPHETYNGLQASQWALAHARDQQPDFDGCAWFISQALWNGGLKKTALWNADLHIPRGLKGIPGEKETTVAASLVGYLRKQYDFTEIRLDRNRFLNNRVPEARVGDIIAYDWGWYSGADKSPGTYDHLAMVVNIAPESYPEVAEWGTVKGGQAPYRKRGWTWSELSGIWLQQAQNDNVFAILIRIDP